MVSTIQALAGAAGLMAALSPGTAFAQVLTEEKPGLRDASPR